jgi:hypothetical protein
VDVDEDDDDVVQYWIVYVECCCCCGGGMWRPEDHVVRIVWLLLRMDGVSTPRYTDGTNAVTTTGSSME